MSKARPCEGSNDAVISKVASGIFRALKVKGRQGLVHPDYQELKDDTLGRRRFLPRGLRKKLGGVCLFFFKGFSSLGFQVWKTLESCPGSRIHDAAIKLVFFYLNHLMELPSS